MIGSGNVPCACGVVLTGTSLSVAPRFCYGCCAKAVAQPLFFFLRTSVVFLCGKDLPFNVFDRIGSPSLHFGGII